MPSLYTIGYEGSTPALLIAELKKAGVKRLIDVRAVANSRKPGFSKNALAKLLGEKRIAYTHLRALGTPKEGRDAAKQGDIAKMKRIFAAQLKTPEAQLALEQAAALAAEEPSCLLCYEAAAGGCHRSIVAREMQRLYPGEIINLHPERT